MVSGWCVVCVKCGWRDVCVCVCVVCCVVLCGGVLWCVVRGGVVCGGV